MKWVDILEVIEYIFSAKIGVYAESTAGIFHSANYGLKNQ